MVIGDWWFAGGESARHPADCGFFARHWEKFAISVKNP
jgi:hypothetical protein